VGVLAAVTLIAPPDGIAASRHAHLAALAGTSCQPITRVELAPAANVCTLRLANGVSVHVRPQRDGQAAGQVWVQVRVHAGEPHETAAERGISALAAASWRLPALEDDRGVTIRAGSLPEGLVLRFEGASDLLDEALEEITAMLTAPSIDPDALSAARARAVARAQRWSGPASAPRGQGPDAGEEPRRGPRSGARMDHLADRLRTRSDDPRLRRPSVESLSACTEQAVAAWLSHVVSVGAVEVSIVGDVDPAEVAQVAGATLAAIPARAESSPAWLGELRSARVDRTPPRVESRGMMPGNRAALVLAVPGADIGDLRAVRLHAIVAAILRERLTALARELHGHSATARVDSMPGRVYPGIGRVMVTFSITAEAETAGAVFQRVTQLLDRLHRDGVGAGEVRGVVEALAAESAARLAEPRYWAEMLPMAGFYGWSISELAEAPEAYRATPADEVVQTLRTVLDPEHRGWVQLLPGPPSDRAADRPDPDPAEHPGHTGKDAPAREADIAPRRAAPTSSPGDRPEP
jgi:predicted Zn-dependent peptidase